MTPNFKAFVVLLLVLFCCFEVFAQPASGPALKMDMEPFGTIPYGVVLPAPSEGVTTPGMAVSSAPSASSILPRLSALQVLGRIGCVSVGLVIVFLFVSTLVKKWW